MSLCSAVTRISLQLLYRYFVASILEKMGSKLSKVVKGSISDQSLNFWAGNVRLYCCCFLGTYCLFHNVYWGSFINSVFGIATGGLLCVGAPSFMTISFSSGSKLWRVCVRKPAKQSKLIPPKKAVVNTKPPFTDIAGQTVVFHPCCPQIRR